MSTMEERRLHRNAVSADYHRRNAAHYREVHSDWRQDNPARCLLGNMRKNAAGRGIPCTITLEELKVLLAPMVCALTGWKLYWDVDEAHDPLAPSPDRITGRLGYVPSNVRIVAWRINQMRGDMTDEELLDAARALIARSAS